MKTLLKSVFWLFCGVCLLAIGAAIWGQRDLARHQALSPAERAAEDTAYRVAAEKERSEQIKGTDCEFLDAAQCYKLRAEERKREAFIRELEESGELDRLREASENAGVR